MKDVRVALSALILTLSAVTLSRWPLNPSDPRSEELVFVLVLVVGLSLWSCVDALFVAIVTEREKKAVRTMAAKRKADGRAIRSEVS